MGRVGEGAGRMVAYAVAADQTVVRVGGVGSECSAAADTQWAIGHAYIGKLGREKAGSVEVADWH